MFDLTRPVATPSLRAAEILAEIRRLYRRLPVHPTPDQIAPIHALSREYAALVPDAEIVVARLGNVSAVRRV
jgi:hypothetical protein